MHVRVGSMLWWRQTFARVAIVDHAAVGALQVVVKHEVLWARKLAACIEQEHAHVEVDFVAAVVAVCPAQPYVWC